jgi:hypothetical protein
MDWQRVYLDSRPHVMRGSINRVLAVGGISSFILTMFAIVVRDLLVFAGAFAFLAFIVGAFWREAVRNGRKSPLVLVGRVTDKGMRGFKDSGGLADAPATRLGVAPQITLQVQEAFDLAPDGTRRPRPEQATEHVIRQIRWYRALERDQQVVLVCLPETTDPVYLVTEDRSRPGG